MPRPNTASLALLSSIDRLGPHVTDEQLCEATGSTAAAISNRIWWLVGRGFIHKVGKQPDRHMTVTAEGREFMAAPVSLSKPRTRNYGPAKRRHCLKCRKRFASTWNGERVCGGCKSTVEWREGYDPEHYTVMGGR